MPSTLFAADDGVHGVELWRTNGTNGRTSLVKDIQVGATGSGPGNFGVGGGGSLPFAALGSYVYFSANDGVHGQELWRSDGTAAGTTEVTDLSGSSGYNPTNIVVANGLIFFLGVGPGSVVGIYETNGTATPTLVSTSVLGIDYMTVSGTHVYWAINDGLSDSGLYASDGTTTGKISNATNEVGLFDAGGGIAYYATTGVGGGPLLKITSGTVVNTVTGSPNAPGNFVNAGGTVFFTTPNSPTVLYSTSTGGTTAASVKTGLNLNNNGTSPVSFAALGSKLIFANADANGDELWVSDGTNAGTVLLKDILPGSTGGQPNSSSPKNLITVGSSVFFQASDGKGGVDLWKTDGTSAGTVLVKHILSGNPSPNDNKTIIPAPDLQNMSVQNGILMFMADDGVDGPELWRSDGTAVGTFMVRDINPTFAANASYQSAPQFTAAPGGVTAFFTGFDVAHGYELWASDGTAATTGIVADINPGSLNSAPALLTRAGTNIFFIANDGVHGAELWADDLLTGNVHMVADINPGASSSNIFSLTPIGNDVYFSADDGSHGSEFWFSDGTAAGTAMLTDINPGSSGGFPNSSSPFGFVQVSGGKVFFTATTAANGTELWVTDGTVAGTHITKDIASGTGSSQISSVTPFGSKVFFAADSGGTGADMELWVSDGTSGGTVLFQNINTNSGQGSFPNSLTVIGSHLVFTANDGGANGTQVWSTDGTNPAVKLTNVAGLSPSNIVLAGSLAYWSGNTASNGFELYSSNGSTITSIDIATGANSSSPNNLTAVNGQLFFTAQDTTTHGTELWVSGGTLATTHMVKDINPASNMSSNPSNLTAVGSLLYFTADDGTDGVELWVSDGTSGGTHLVKDIAPGSASSSPSSLKAVGSRLMFQANDGTNGSELWITDGTAAGTVRVTNTLQPTGSNPSNFSTVPFTIPGAVTLPNVILHNTSTLDTRDWLMAGGIVGTNLVLGNSPAGWKIIGTGDFNGDGIGDLIYENTSTGELRDWILSNAGVASNIVLGSIPSGWTLVGTGDFNGDGISDVLWRNTTTSDLRIWTMKAGAVAGNTVVPNPPSDWSVQAIGDFNGDGTSDIIWRSASSGDVRDWGMLNNALSTNVDLGAAPLSFGIAATGDFNGDGTTDILWQDSTSGDVRDWLMQNHAVSNNIDIGATSYHVLAEGSFNGDAADDLLWRNASTGDLREWNMSGGVPGSQNLLGTLPTTWVGVVNPATHSGDPNPSPGDIALPFSETRGMHTVFAPGGFSSSPGSINSNALLAAST